MAGCGVVKWIGLVWCDQVDWCGVIKWLCVMHIGRWRWCALCRSRVVPCTYKSSSRDLDMRSVSTSVLDVHISYLVVSYVL